MIRSLAGILLRRTIDPVSPHGSKIDDNTTAQLRTELMNIWAREQNHIILRRLSHIIAQSASNGKWVDLIPSIVSHGSTISESTGLIPLIHIIEIIADYCPDDVLTHSQCLISFLGENLSSDDGRVQISAAKATGACIVTLEDDGARADFKPAGMTFGMSNDGVKEGCRKLYESFIWCSSTQWTLHRSLHIQSNFHILYESLHFAPNIVNLTLFSTYVQYNP